MAKGWSDALRATGAGVDVLVKVDVGFHRCGIDPEAAGAAEMIARVAEMPGLRFRGLLSHAGHAYHASSDAETAAIAASEASLLNDLAARVRDLGVPVEEISVGSTPTARFSLQQKGLTELRPGNYIYYDRTQVALGAASYEDCALTVLARVVSRPAADRVILDSGSKTLALDQARGASEMRGHGAVFESLDSSVPDRSLVIERLSEEHATVRVDGKHDARDRRPGAHPSQPCVRRVESRRRRLARERSAGGGADRDCGSRPNRIVEWRPHGQGTSRRGARAGRNARPRRHDRSR